MRNRTIISKLWAIIEEGRGTHQYRYEPTELLTRLKEQKLLPELHEISEITNILATSSVARGGGPFPVPAVLIDAITKILASRKANKILDPWAGLGALLAVAKQATSAEKCIGINTNAAECELAQSLFPSAEWRFGHALELLPRLQNSFDVAVSLLPLHYRTNDSIELEGMAGKQIVLKGDLGYLILAATMARLSDNGVGLFVVPSSFFFSGRSILKYFPDLGYRLDAAISLPAGTFTPYTSIGTYLVVATKGRGPKTFVAQLSNDHNTNTQIFENFIKGKEGGAVELGRYIDALSFRGIDSLRAGEYFDIAAKKIGLPAVSLEEISTEIILGRFGEEFEFPPLSNAVFIPIIGQSDVVESRRELRLKLQNYAQVVIDPKKSFATFVAQFLNTELGKMTREWGKSGATIPKLNKQTLKKIQVLIPDLATQRQMLDIEGRLTAEENTLLSLRNDLQDLRRDLWRNPRSAASVSDRLDQFGLRMSRELNEQANIGLDHWFETIPFPIASILRAWQATPSDDYKTKHEHLLRFFEATAEFVSIILLSAFIGNETLFASHRQKIITTMKKQNLSFQRATFGTWKFVVEYLGKQTRLLLNESDKTSEDATNDREVCATIFADPTLKLPRLLSSKDMIAILEATNTMRNDWSGHGGIVGQEEAKVRNDQLLGQLVKLRQAMADVWETALVVNALHCRPRNGVFENEIALLRGSNSEFLKESRVMSTWLDVDSLYIINGQRGTALKLLPLIQVSASPGTSKNACYFFNRLGNEGTRFVSYHYAGQPELSGQNQAAIAVIMSLSES